MNPRVEEVSDSDSDPPESGLDDVNSLIVPSHIPSTSSSTHVLQPQSPAVKTTSDREKSKHYQCLYPVYFDRARTRAEGRRVSSELAVDNPLAWEMANAASSLGLHTVFEPDRTHPKDWSNPGRIRVLLKQDGRIMSKSVKNKHHLYILMARYLKAHPTQPNTPLRLPIAGLPKPQEPLPEPTVPRGWKMNTILPLHSPALTGGGVSESFLQDMLAEMQGEGGAGAGAVSGGSKRKEKKKK